MTQIGWDETTPADTESVSLGDDRIRSLKTSLRQGLSAEHTWPSGGGDSGVHLLGSARAYVGSQSQVSSAGTDGRMMWASDTSRLFHTGSDGTVYIGGARGISAGAVPGSIPQRAIWVEEFGVAAVTGLSATVTIPNSGYSGVPCVFLTQNEPATTVYVRAGAMNVTPTSFLISLDDASAHTIAWRSIGTRAL